MLLPPSAPRKLCNVTVPARAGTSVRDAGDAAGVAMRTAHPLSCCNNASVHRRTRDSGRRYRPADRNSAINVQDYMADNRSEPTHEIPELRLLVFVPILFFWRRFITA